LIKPLRRIPNKTKSLTDLILLKRGYDLPSQDRQDGEIPILGSFGITGSHNCAKHPGPGVSIGRSGASIGVATYTDGPYWPLNTTLYVTDFQGNDPRFVYYVLDSIDFRAFNSGGAIPSLNRNYLGAINVPDVSLRTQHKIAAVLSAYDDYIENNNRRIGILEEMAQRIYREWFVDFRYPGHEDIPLVDSELGRIPEGWEVRSFSALGEYVNGYAFKPEDWGGEGPPIVKIRELKNGVTDETPRFGGDIGEKYVISDGDLLFSWSAHLDAYLWTGGQAWLNQHLFRVDPAPGVPSAFLFHALRERMEEFRSRAQGTTMRHIKRAALTQVATLVPPESIRNDMAELVAPVDALTLGLVRATRNLRATRDLLLPRLISGEVDVTDLDVAMPEAVA
jgi:type I restriction enzyme S subunit